MKSYNNKRVNYKKESLKFSFAANMRTYAIKDCYVEEKVHTYL